MKLIVLLLMPAVASACQPGYVPSDTPGVCVEKSGETTNPAWVSDEKPPKDKMPSYQREGVVIIDAKNMATEDAKLDQEKREADEQGKKTAGLK